MWANGLKLGAILSSTMALSLEVGNLDSSCEAATEIIDGIMDYYTGYRYGGTVGYFQEPYYWWEAGLCFGAMIDTWTICNNDTYVQMLQASIYHQAGPNFNYMLLNQSHVEANDDQLFWGLTVMEAAERGLPPVDDSSDASYLEMSQAVYNTVWERWNDASCGGGLSWQIFSNMSGYDYKSTASNAGLFALGARLGRFTGNQLYFDTCTRVSEWLKESSFVTKQDDYYIVYDGADETNNCGTINGYIWSYNYALMIMGSTYMYNATGDSAWSDDLQLYLNGLEHYMVVNGVLNEYACETRQCNNDQRVFKAVVARSLGEVVQLVPSMAAQAQSILDTSAAAAALSCSGGSDGKTCGMNWTIGGWDGMYGLGEQICALETIQNSVISQAKPPLKASDVSNDDGDFTFGLESLTPTLLTRTHTSFNTHTVEATTTVLATVTKVVTV